MRGVFAKVLDSTESVVGEKLIRSRCHIPGVNWVITLALVAGASVAVRPQTSGAAAFQAVQGEANSKPGPRSVPAKVIPVPADVDSDTAAAIAAPYSSLSNLDPPDDAGWRAVQHAAAAGLPMLAQQRTTLGVSIEATTVGGVRAFILTPRDIPERHKNQLVINLHPGGYVFGAGESGTGEGAMMAAYGGYKVIVIDYRMPPDGPYPAGMDDVMRAWRAVAATMNPRRVAIEGTSTGGGMTLALMLRLKAERLPLPGAIAPGSPWSDMTETGDSYKTNQWVDNVVPSYSPYLANAARLYAHGHDLKDPQLSPIYGDFHGLPPAVLTAGTRDLFLSNTVRAHRKLREAGVEADLQVYEGLSHAQYLSSPTAPVTKEVFGEITRFFDAHLAP